MANYVLVYSGGGTPESESKRQAVMAAWGYGMRLLAYRSSMAATPSDSRPR